MAYFAQIDANNTVIQVIVADHEFINSGAVGNPNSWIETSMNTRNGVYYDPETGEPAADQSLALRENYAGIGYAYDPIQDAFFPPKESTLPPQQGATGATGPTGG